MHSSLLIHYNITHLHIMNNYVLKGTRVLYKLHSDCIGFTIMLRCLNFKFLNLFLIGFHVSQNK